MQLAGVQSYRQCADSLKSASPYRASGFDQVSSALLTKAPLAAARHYHPLLAKVQFTAAEPSEFKGSISHPLLKPDKTPVRAIGYRSISLKNDIAKHHHKYLCRQLLNAVTGFFA